MRVGVVTDRLKELGKASSFSASEKSEIEVLYREVLDKSFVKTSCNDCYRDAVFEMYAYLKKNGRMKERTLYRLKNGVLLQMAFGSGDFYTNANLTDEVAERYLGRYPERVNYFAVVPDDWQKRARKRVKGRPVKEKESAPNTEAKEE